MLTVIVFLLVFIIVLPAIIVIPQAFTSLNYFTYPIPEFVTKWIDKFWENSEWVVGLTRSLVIAVIVAVVATVLGTLAAVAMQKLEFKGKGLFMGLMISPMVIPVVIIGVALYSTFSQSRTDEYLYRINTDAHSAGFTYGVRNHEFRTWRCKSESGTCSHEHGMFPCKSIYPGCASCCKAIFDFVRTVLICNQP